MATDPDALSTRVEQIVLAAQRQAEAVERDIESRRRAAELEVTRWLEDVRREADQLTDDRLRALDSVVREVFDRADRARTELDGLLDAIARVRKTFELDRGLQDAAFGWPESPVGDDPEPAPAAATTSAPLPSEVADVLPPDLRARIETRAAELAEEQRTPAPPTLAKDDAPALAPTEPARTIPPAVQEAQFQAARLVARELLAAGRSRADVERHLRSAFVLDDPAAAMEGL